MDEIGYLFEGLEGVVEGGGGGGGGVNGSGTASVGLSRSSALEMVGKFCDAGFLKRAKAAGFVERAWGVLRCVRAGEGDKVSLAIG
jgi:hypothetical protein